jgi:hypothetical protein
MDRAMPLNLIRTYPPCAAIAFASQMFGGTLATSGIPGALNVPTPASVISTNSRGHFCAALTPKINLVDIANAESLLRTKDLNRLMLRGLAQNVTRSRIISARQLNSCGKRAVLPQREQAVSVELFPYDVPPNTFRSSPLI